MTLTGQPQPRRHLRVSQDAALHRLFTALLMNDEAERPQSVRPSCPCATVVPLRALPAGHLCILCVSFCHIVYVAHMVDFDVSVGLQHCLDPRSKHLGSQR